MIIYSTLRKKFTMVLAQAIFAVSIVLVAALPQVIALLIDFVASSKSGLELELAQ